jgi:hypothetical protein
MSSGGLIPHVLTSAKEGGKFSSSPFGSFNPDKRAPVTFTNLKRANSLRMRKQFIFQGLHFKELNQLDKYLCKLKVKVVPQQA